MSAPHIWTPPQLARLSKGGVPRSVDVHCHCLPGLDDGPRTVEDALELCGALVEDGITTVIATPHQLGAYDGVNTSAIIRSTLTELAAELREEGLPLELLPGADVRVDERLARLIDADRVLTVGDMRKHVLLELPHDLYVDPATTIAELHERGLQTILTHPERHRYLHSEERQIAGWVAAGVAVQITAGSLLGDFGSSAEKQAWRLVEAGLVSLIATDAHDARRRPPCLAAAEAALEAEIGADAAIKLCLQNPWRVLQGERIDPWKAK